MGILGNKIKVLRKRAGLSQGELGEAIGISQSRISRIEKGIDKLYQPEQLEPYSKALGVPKARLVEALDAELEAEAWPEPGAELEMRVEDVVGIKSNALPELKVKKIDGEKYIKIPDHPEDQVIFRFQQNYPDVFRKIFLEAICEMFSKANADLLTDLNVGEKE